MVLNPLLKTNDIEREKGVILEEMAMYEDTPMKKIGDLYENLAFKGSSLGRDIIGTKNSVMGISRKDFVEYRKSNYRAENVVVTVSGGIDEKKTLKLLEKYFSKLKKGKNKGFNKYVKKDKGPLVFLKEKNNEQAHFIMGFYSNPRGHKDRFSEAVLATLLGGGMSSRMFTKVREEKGLAYAISTSSETYQDVGLLATYAGVDIKRVDEAVETVKEVYYNLRDKKEKVGEKELDKAKEYLKGHLALGLEDTKAVNSFFGLKELLRGVVETPDEVYKGVDRVETDDIERLADEFFKPERLSFALIGPFKQQKRFEKLLT
jgi:predicted Zn-dependent peptidase